jgi:hypothetical protein
MTDRKLNVRLRAVDDLAAPDLWDRARTLESSPRSTEGRGRNSSRVVAGLVAIALVVGAAWGLWEAFGRDEVTNDDATPVGEPSIADPFAALPPGWTELATPPDRPCCDVWTGEELITWSGPAPDSEERLLGDGYRFDPITGETTPMSEGPLAPRSLHATAWTGSEYLVWGGWSGGGGPFFDDGAAYDPSTDTWRPLPPADISARVPLSAWTGTEWIVWGTRVRVDDRPRDGAIYDPAADAWRSMTDAPIEVTDATASWTGEEFVVVGAALHGGNFPETPTAIAAAYDPNTDRWRELPASPLSPNSNLSVWTGDRIVGMDYDHVTAELTLSGDWVELGRLPGDQCEGGLGPAQSAGGWVLVQDCNSVYMLPPGSNEWTVDPTAPAWLGGMLQAGDSIIATSGSFLPDQPRRMWVVRPGSRGEIADALVVRVRQLQDPFDVWISASFGGSQIDLEAIETPGPELHYPDTRPIDLPAGTPIVIDSIEGVTVSVFELAPFDGELFGEGSCIVPGAVRVLPGPDEKAFFIYVQGDSWSAGQGFVAETSGSPVDHEAAVDGTSDVNANLLGLTVCNSD